MVPELKEPAPRGADVLLVVLFVAALSLPMGVKLFGLESATLAENRVRAAMPELKFEKQALAQYPTQFDAYFSDSFGLRDRLIRWNNLAKVRVLGVSSSPAVLIGSAGWLFYTGDMSVEDYRRSRPFPPEDLEQWRAILEAKRDWLARRGIRYLVVIAPNKHTIYPEFVPKSVTRTDGESRLDQLASYLHGKSDLALLDLREPLLKSKGSQKLYFRRDTHWNGRGAFLGYQALGGALAKWFPGVKPVPASECRVIQSARVNPDLSLMLGLGDVLKENDYRLEPLAGHKARVVDPGAVLVQAKLAKQPLPVATECQGEGLPRAVVFGDSFFGALFPHMAEHFSHSLYVWHTRFDTQIIEQERPQVVIEEFVERKLYLPPPIPPDLAARIARK